MFIISFNLLRLFSAQSMQCMVGSESDKITRIRRNRDPLEFRISIKWVRIRMKYKFRSRRTGGTLFSPRYLKMAPLWVIFTSLSCSKPDDTNRRQSLNFTFLSIKALVAICKYVLFFFFRVSHYDLKDEEKVGNLTW